MEIYEGGGDMLPESVLEAWQLSCGHTGACPGLCSGSQTGPHCSNPAVW